MASTPDHVLPQSGRLPRGGRGRIGLIVAGSLAAGLVAAVALAAASFVPAKENVLTGAVLLGFAVGWALLALLSVRFSDQPQRWAVAPAVFFAVAGLIALLPPALPFTMCSAGCGHRCCSGSLCGCSSGSDDRCVAESDGG